MMVLDTHPVLPEISPAAMEGAEGAAPTTVFAQLLGMFLPPSPALNSAVPAQTDSAPAGEANTAPIMNPAVVLGLPVGGLAEFPPAQLTTPALLSAQGSEPSLEADSTLAPAAMIGQLVAAPDSALGNGPIAPTLAETDATDLETAPDDELPGDDLTRASVFVAAPLAPAVISPAATEVGASETQRREITSTAIPQAASEAGAEAATSELAPALPPELATEPMAELAAGTAPRQMPTAEQAPVTAPAIASGAAKPAPSPRPAPGRERELEIDLDPKPAPATVTAIAAPAAVAKGDGAAGSKSGDDSADQGFEHHLAQRQEPMTPALPFSALAPAVQNSHGEGVGAPAWQPTVDGLARQIADHLRIGKQEAVLQLDPPELGKVKIDLRLEDGQLHMRIAAEGADAQRLIEHHLGDLHQALHGRQIEVADLRVAQGEWQAGGGLAQDFDRPPQQRQDGAQGFAGMARGDEAAAEPARPARRASDGRVSMWA